MDLKKSQLNQKSRFLKLSLKKNKIENCKNVNKLNRSSDVIILDESFDRLRSEISKRVNSPVKIYSPIVINDSHDDDLLFVKTPSKNGNVSFNYTKEETSIADLNDSKPSNGGWSPAQNILSATPRTKPVPSTPKDIANESFKQCSLKKIQQSQKKLLDDLYGNAWKSIPTLFKTISHKHSNFDGVSKKLNFNDEDSDKENIRQDLEKHKNYLTGSDVKRKKKDLAESEKKSKKKLYTEKVPSTPDVSKKIIKINAKSTSKKPKKAMSVTELVEVMRNDVDILTRKVESVTVTQKPRTPEFQRLSFIGSLADNVPSWRCHPEAIQYHDKYKTLRESLARRLFTEFNKSVFDGALDDDMPIIWDTKLRSTAGTTTNRLIKNTRGDRLRTSSIKLSTKVIDGPQRLRDTLIHELCHAATWLIDEELRAGHGPLWKKWAKKSLRVFPELCEITRCHDMEIHFKYVYKCTKCGYSIKRHSKSIDVTKKCCGYCRGTFELIVNRKNKDGLIISTPARKGQTNEFAQFVKENYGEMKQGKTHAQVMKVLGEQFSAKKNKLHSGFEKIAGPSLG